MTESDGPDRYLHPTREAGRAFAERSMSGPLVMLNLLRFREVADYSATPDIAPPQPITGREAYALYIAHAVPYLKASGGDILFVGEGSDFLIGPSEERWDRVALINHGSIEAFMQFAMDKGYLAGAGHRVASLLDSRLLPLENLRKFW